MLSDELFEKCLRALYFAPEDHPSFALLLDMHGSPDGLSAALAVAFAAGRESAYDRDEWRVVAGPDEFPAVFQDEISSEEHLAIVLRDARNRWRGEEIWIQHCRNGSTPWSRVPEAGGPGELQA